LGRKKGRDGIWRVPLSEVYWGAAVTKRQTKTMRSNERSFWLDDMDTLLTE